MSDAAHTVEVTSDKETLEEFRNAILSNAEFNMISVDPPLRSKQFGSVGEVVLTLVLHIPPGIAAHALYEWIKSWRSKKGTSVKQKTETDS